MEPSGLNPQANPAVNQEYLTPSMSVGRGTPGVPGTTPLFPQGDEAPNIDCQNPADTAVAAGFNRPTLLSGCSMHVDSTQRAALPGSMSGAAEQDGSSVRSSCNLPTGCTEVPISIFVDHRRKTGRGPMPWLPLSHTSTPVAAMPGVSEDSEDAASIQLATSDFLSLGRASNVGTNDMAMNPSELATPVNCNSEHTPMHSQPIGLDAEAPQTGMQTEDSQVSSSATVVCASNGKVESVLPVNSDESQGQQTKESTSVLAEGVTDHNMHKYQQTQKKLKTQSQLNDHTILLTPAAFKEMAFTKIGRQISGSENFETLQNKETPARVAKPRRKKHRAKVIREDNQGKKQKPTVTTPEVKSPNQNAKRSYVRKKRNLNSLEKCSGPLGDQSILGGAQNAARSRTASVRRRLLFELGEQGVQGDQSSTGNSCQEVTPNQKPTVTTPEVKSPNQNAKRSYVRKKRILNSLENCSGPLSDQSIPGGAENAARSRTASVRRRLLFELGEQGGQGDQSSTGNSCHHLKEKLIHAESSSCSATTMLSTAQSGHVLHVDMENSVGGLAFYMSRELHKQLDEYLHLPEIAPKTTQEISPATSGCCSREPTRQQDNVGSTHDLDATSMGVSVTEGNTKHLELNCSTKDGFDMHGSDTYIPETASTESQVTKVSKVEKKEHRQHRESESSLTGPGDSIISRTASWMLAFCLAGGVTKKRSVRLRRKSFVSIMYSEKNNAQAFKILPQSCMEAPYEKSCIKSVTRKRTPRARLRSGSSIQPNVVFSGATAGLSNSLVPFGGQMIVPYESPLLVKKQGHRAKVNLDSETTRVWNLLMGKATEPLDGADVDKERWWQQEREVFEGRANSFIARMRLVQGDRHFSPWKGSVVDSVVGVFLTQNVSDHLSSSAYMALAASFPVNSNCKDDIASQDNEEIISTSLGENVEELSITYNGNILVETQNKTSAYEFTKAENYSFYSKEATEGICDHQETVIDDRAQMCPGFSMELTASIIKPPDIQFQKDMSSYQSVMISETILQSRLSLSSGKNYPPGNRVGSVVGAASQQLGSNFDGGNLLTGNDATTKEHECQRINSLAASVYDDGVGEREIPSTSMMYYPFISVDRQQPDVTNEPHVSTTSPNSSTGSASSLLKNGTTGNKLPLFMPSDDHTAQNNRSKTVISTQDSPESSTDLPVELHGDNITRFEASNLQEYESLSSTGGMIAETANVADVFTSYNRVMDKAAQASRPKKKRTTNKENTETIDWDKFRRKACDDGYVKGKEIERRDSVDWEAVRCADVHRIAHAIRERGMNNMLADRIQSFLNRLVRDHGSIDLEWLRDISPDSVKDYLLSIDGLGLKSVECVRLLTLQHLAFPVDTNVGRICVRLGWVPIQPLPESLQLHLLELLSCVGDYTKVPLASSV